MCACVKRVLYVLSDQNVAILLVYDKKSKLMRCKFRLF